MPALENPQRHRNTCKQTHLQLTAAPPHLNTMSDKSDISWTYHTFNPWMGCTMVSPACLNCYAKLLAWRFYQLLWGAGTPRRLAVDSYWDNALIWNRRARKKGVRNLVFCLSMGDFFDAEVPAEWRERIWNIIRICDSLDWQILTKRPENIISMLPPDWGDGWDHVRQEQMSVSRSFSMCLRRYAFYPASHSWAR